METKWEYDLPTNEHSEDYQYKSPISKKDNMIYFISRLYGETNVSFRVPNIRCRTYRHEDIEE